MTINQAKAIIKNYITQNELEKGFTSACDLLEKELGRDAFEEFVESIDIYECPTDGLHLVFV
jgi:hypothetical protein